MTSEHAISYEDLERRRQKAAAARKPSVVQAAVETESEAMRVINEIFNPTLKLPVTTGPYRPPEELSSDDFDALRDLDVRKLAELKEVFLLFDTDCDGLISKEDLRFTFGALGSDASEELLEEMLKEAKEPLDVDAFVELMSYRTVELDPEDVLLEAWSKWDLYGTGKIEERNCLDYIEIFPYLREPVVENTTQPEHLVCNQTRISAAVLAASSSNNKSTGGSKNSINNKNLSSPLTMSDVGSPANISSAGDLPPHEFIYSSAKIIAIRLRFTKPLPPKVDDWHLNISAEYRFLKKENFKTDGRLIPGTYCDYYFFANAEVKPSGVEIWKYFHSPRFPAKYPPLIKCSFKFIGSPESRVEVVIEELRIPKSQGTGCSLDKLTIFDAESVNTNAIVDVLCGIVTSSRHFLSTGPDLLIEFNASSNVTSKGFRGKFKFIENGILDGVATDSAILLGKIRKNFGKQNDSNPAPDVMESTKISKGLKDENCRQIFDSRWNKSGVFESSQLFSEDMKLTNIKSLVKYNNTGRVECIYEFNATGDERVQIKFLDFNIPSEPKNSTEYFGITTGHQLGRNCSFVYNSTIKKTGFFTSPNFPGLYPQNIACHYFFYGEFDEKVKIHFSFFDVEGIDSCGYLTASDYVEFSNFLSTDRKFGRYCGKRDKFEVRSDDRFFRISFFSNDRFDRNGFRAYYEFEGIPKPSENSSLQSYTSVSSKVRYNTALNKFLVLAAEAFHMKLFEIQFKLF